MLSRLWNVDDDIAAGWALITEESRSGVIDAVELSEPSDVGKLLKKFPSGFCVSPSGDLFVVIKVEKYSSASNRGDLIVRRTGKKWYDETQSA